MAIASPIPGISNLRIVDSDGRPTPEFVRIWGSLGQAIAVNANAITAQGNATTSAQQTAQIAQQTANQPPPSGGTSGATTTSGLVVTSLWAQGPTVSLTGVSAGDLTANVTLALGSPGPITTNPVIGGVPENQGYAVYYSADGEIRIVEVIGGVDTVVFPTSGSAAFTAYAYLSAAGGTAGIIPTFQSALQSFVSTRASTGAVDYRLDLRMTSPASSQITPVQAYLYANRA